MPTDEEEYMTVADAADKFAAKGVSAPRIYRWLATGRVKRYRRQFDGATMVKPSEIEGVLASMTTVLPAEEED